MTRINKFNYNGWGGEISTLQDESNEKEIRLEIYRVKPEGGLSVEMDVIEAKWLIEYLHKAIKQARKERK